MKEKTIKFAKAAYRFSNSWPGTIIIVLLIIFFVAQAFRIPSGSMKDSLLVGDHLFAKKFAYGISTPHLPFLEIPLVPGTDGHIIDGDTPERGDIVIFRYPHNTKLHYVKRCVAIPGDELFLEGKVLYLHPREGDAYVQKHYPVEQGLSIERDGKLWIKAPYQKEHPGIHNDPKIDEDTPVLIDSRGRMQMLRKNSPDYFHIKQNIVHLKSDIKLYDHNPIFAYPVYRVPEDHYFMMGDNRDHSNDSRFWGPVPYSLIEGTPWFIYFSMDDDYEIRWDRIGKSASDLEQKEYLDKAVEERLRVDKDDYGLY
jgi:signal peptidase I